MGLRRCASGRVGIDSEPEGHLLDVVFDRGVYLPSLDLWLDSKKKREEGYISHAHSDHTAAHGKAVLTGATSILLRKLLRRSETHTLEYGEGYETDRYTLTLYPSGHCLGSALALVECKATGERILYTGDFRAKENPTSEPLATVPCDVLIMECTYGREDYVFPPQDDVLEDFMGRVFDWTDAGGVTVALAYRMGKAQELLHHLLSRGYRVALEEGAYEVTRSYEEAGVEFPHAEEFRVFDGRVRDGEVLIFPSGRKTREKLRGVSKKLFLGMSGWAMDSQRAHWTGADESFAFSDHCDYPELLAYVEATGAREIYTVFGFPDLARDLRAMGYKAAHLEKGRASVQLKFA